MQPIQSELRAYASPERAAISRRFFKTGPGQYGEGDEFIGVTVPNTRSVARAFFSKSSLFEIQILLESKIHEERLLALEMLVMQYEKNKDPAQKAQLKDFYLEHLDGVNNWDLVDGSAPYILGDFLLDHDRSILYKLAESKNLWERRVAMISTYTFIRNGDFDDALKLAEKLLNDAHDLMHKAVGWMLREIGKKDEAILRNFLKKNAANMPRTALRYAIERFSKEERAKWLATKALSPRPHDPVQS